MGKCFDLLLHKKILDGDEIWCLDASTMVDGVHKPFSFLLQQSQTQNDKQKNVF